MKPELLELYILRRNVVMIRILNESREGIIYHSCSVNNLLEIIKNNKLSPRHHGSVCLTRSFVFASTFLKKNVVPNILQARVILELDLFKITSNYKVTPISDYGNMIVNGTKLIPTIKSRYKGTNNAKAEERLPAGQEIKNINKYIKTIYLQEIVKDCEHYDDLLELLSDFNIKYFK